MGPEDDALIDLIELYQLSPPAERETRFLALLALLYPEIERIVPAREAHEDLLWDVIEKATRKTADKIRPRSYSASQCMSYFRYKWYRAMRDLKRKLSQRAMIVRPLRDDETEAVAKRRSALGESTPDGISLSSEEREWVLLLTGEERDLLRRDSYEVRIGERYWRRRALRGLAGKGTALPEFKTLDNTTCCAFRKRRAWRLLARDR